MQKLFGLEKRLQKHGILHDMHDKQSLNEQETNLAKVASEFLKNPNATVREVAEVTDVPKSTVHDIKGRIGQIGHEDVVQRILKRDEEIIELAQEKLREVLSGEEKPKYGGELSSVVSALSDSTKRRQLFSNKPTENLNLTGLTDEQLRRVLERNEDNS